MANDGSVKIGVGFDVDKDELSNIDKTLDASLSGASKKIDVLQGSLSKIGGVAKNTLSVVGDVSATMISTTVKGIAAAATAYGSLLTYGVNYNAQIEQYKASFEVMTGSAEKAAEVMERLVKIGASTPFETKDLAEVTQLLMNYGFTADNAIDSMMMLGDIAQGDSDKMQRIANAYGQMSSAGKVSLEDIKQMIEAGFNPLQEISESTGESMESLYDRISLGAISVDEITESMKRSTSEGGKYFQSMEKQSQTVSGQISTLKNNFAQLAGAIAGGTSDSLASTILPKLNDALGEMEQAFDERGLEGLAEVFGETLTELISDAVNELPELLEVGENLINSIASGIKKNAPELSKSILETALNIPPFIASNMETFLEIAVAFVSGISQGLKANKSALLNSGTDLFKVLYNAFDNAIGFTVESIPGLIDFISNELLTEDNLEKFFDAGYDLFFGIIGGIAECSPEILAELPKLIGSIVSELTKPEHLQKLLQTGIDLITSLASGIPEASQNIGEAVGSVAENIKKFILETDWAQVGKDIVNGILTGFLDCEFDIEKYVGEFGDNWITGVKDIFDIHSPSRVMKDEVGKNLALGVGEGFIDSLNADYFKEIRQHFISGARELVTPITNSSVTNIANSKNDNSNYSTTNSKTENYNTFIVRNDKDIYTISEQLSKSTSRINSGLGIS